MPSIWRSISSVLAMEILQSCTEPLVSPLHWPIKNCSISNVLAMEILQSCTEPLISPLLWPTKSPFPSRAGADTVIELSPQAPTPPPQYREPSPPPPYSFPPATQPGQYNSITHTAPDGSQPTTTLSPGLPCAVPEELPGNYRPRTPNNNAGKLVVMSLICKRDTVCCQVLFPSIQSLTKLDICIMYVVSQWSRFRQFLKLITFWGRNRFFYSGPKMWSAWIVNIGIRIEETRWFHNFFCLHNGYPYNDYRTSAALIHSGSYQ